MTGPHEETSGPPVVVCIEDSRTQAALAFGVHEARKRKCAIHLVHVLDLPRGYGLLDPSERSRRAALGTLSLAARRTQRLAAGRVPVTCELIEHNHLVNALTDCVNKSQLGVLQHHPAHHGPGLTRRSLADRVAARSTVPVAWVPTGWQPTCDAAFVVTVVVDDVDRSTAHLHTAAVGR